MGGLKTFVIDLRNIISLRLLILFIASLTLIPLTINSSPVRELFCEGGLCLRSENYEFWNQLINIFAVGSVITILFHWILVKKPQNDLRKRVKAHLAEQHRNFKLSCIENFLVISESKFDHDLPQKLLSVSEFRNQFSQNRRELWYAVHNNMNDYYLQVTLSRMKILREEISSAMQTIDMTSTESSRILKELSHIITLQENASTDYDSIRSFLGVFWSLFTAWDNVEGYSDIDPVEDMINKV